MDFENFDERVFSPEQTTLNRYLRAFGVLLLATFLLPIDRGKNVWDAFGVVSALDAIRLVLPAAVGLGFVYLGFVARIAVLPKAAAIAGSLALVLVVGVDPFEVLRVAVPPVAGGCATTLFGMVDGHYWPREDLLHRVLLGAGLLVLGIGGRYRTLRLRSMIGPGVMIAGTVILLGYYLWPYDSSVPAKYNIELYKMLHATPAAVEAGELQGSASCVAQMRFHMEGGKGGQMKLSAVYFLVIYFVPLAIAAFSGLAWRRGRYRGHGAVPARLAGWGSVVYLLAFLFPLLVKEGLRKTGVGFLPNLRSYILLAGIFVGLLLAVPLILREKLEPKAADDGLPDDPFSWAEG